MREKHTIPEGDDCPAQLQRAADYIQEHFAEDLSLEKLASVACYSKYHFHRLFREHFGETVNDRIRRVRLEQAAYRLRSNPDKSVDEIAGTCGFSSAQYFAKAFKAQFGESPSAFRKSTRPVDIRPAIPAADEADKKPPLQVEIKELPPFRVAFIRVAGSRNPDDYIQAFRRLFLWAAAKELFNEQLIVIGAHWFHLKMKPFDPFDFDACLTVSGNITGEGEVGIQHFSGGQYAVLHCEDILEENLRQIDRLYYEWLPVSGYGLGDGPFFMFYGNDPEINPRKISIQDQCLPIKTL